jgi:uncharacterized 2Fe-2S/4Fe-4S cluster protein (DUF4445 family)
MPKLTVNAADGIRNIPYTPGPSVRDVLDETDLRVRAGCNGRGACGLCRIRIAGGEAGAPSANEQDSLGPELISQGVRLACQVHATGDLRIELLSPAPASVWRSLGSEEGAAGASSMHGDHPLGAAVDLGTTHLSITLSDLPRGVRLAGRRGLNPQSSCGADVMTRLISASSAGQAETLSQQVVRAIGDGLRDIGSREGIDLSRVTRVVLVGNTAMLAILSGKNQDLLLQPRYWTETIDCLPADTAPWAASWGISPHAAIEVIPPLAGFVGSDLLSGVAVTRLMEQGPGALLIDFGTNSEMALWDGEKLWATSAAGGPAFEGCGISCGMPAEPGAISRVFVPEETGELSFEVISGAEARGVCGTGLVDLLACLLRNGTVNRKGQFARTADGDRFPFRANGRELSLTKKDIDVFQRAKAAIGTGISVLLAKAGMGFHELTRISIGGVFGRHLDIGNARELGLLPAVPARLIETAGNTALAGCEALLLIADREKRLQSIRDRAITVNLSSCDNFEELFIENLYLQPIGSDTAVGQGR